MGLLTPKVLVCGKGVTGTATGAVFEQLGYDVQYADPPKGLLYEDLKGPFDVAFVCVPTPTGDVSYVDRAVYNAAPRAKVVLVRSTVPPGTIGKLQKEFGLKIGLMPEFLREEYAIEDALKKDRAFFHVGDDALSAKLKAFFVMAGYQDVRECGLEALEALKIGLNSMLAIKVWTANLLYDVTGPEHYAELKDLMEADGWVTPFGMQVPGRHGRGFSGTCLPKDLGWLADVLQPKYGLEGCILRDILISNAGMLAIKSDTKEVIK